jgi:hypothetical protein
MSKKVMKVELTTIVSLRFSENFPSNASIGPPSNGKNITIRGNCLKSARYEINLPIMLLGPLSTSGRTPRPMEDDSINNASIKI